MGARNFDPSLIHGSVAPGFEEVEAAFRDNFARGRELGASCAIYHRGQKVVDLWGGHRDEQKQAPWEEDTLVPVFSTTKGIAALTMAVDHSQGLFGYDEPVANYWPEFASEGKQQITIRQLLAHQAGLCAIDEPLDLDLLADLDAVAAVVARQKPAWEPGTRHGYHCWTLGLYQNELIRRLAPQRRSINRFLQDELAGPLDAEFYIGLPAEVPDSRLATLKAFSHLRLFSRIDQIPLGFTLRYMIPGSLARRTTINPSFLTDHANMNRRDVLSLELASATGVGHARAIARMYGSFATGGREINLRQQTLELLTAPAVSPRSGLRDAVFGIDLSYSLGLFKPWHGFRFGSPSSFGVPGAGGSFGFADPEVQIGFGYTPNKMDVYFVDDPRHKSLRSALYRCLDKARD